MKKCLKCQIVYYWDKRMRCLYCDAFLVTVQKDDAAKDLSLDKARAIVAQIIRDRRVSGEGHIQYVIASFFKTRTLYFMYAFSRNDYKAGRDYKRALIQPLNLSSFLIIPWVAYDFVDTFFFRLFYQGYCEKCGWKYNSLTQGREHDAKECVYNQEYTAIIEDVLSGRIVETEEKYAEIAAEKKAGGLRSAYLDLCGHESQASKFFDIFVILGSVWFLAYLFILALRPLFFGFSSEGAGTMYLR